MKYLKKKKCTFFQKHIDIIHVVGNYEQKILKEIFYNKPIRNIPIFIYENQLTKVEKDFSKRNGIIYVGGFLHIPNLDAVLWFINDIFPESDIFFNFAKSE